jgi:hypothetical protein
MEACTRTSRYFRWAIISISIAVLMVGSGLALAQSSDAEKRLSVTTESTRVQRDAGVSGIISKDEFDALVSEGTRDTGKRVSVQSKAGASILSATNVDFWFYTADVILFGDHDGDGYFQGIDLMFDADTYFSSVDVYAVVYLSYEGGPWNEYAATENFTIFGSSSDDDYVVVTELVDGYPSGSYDILIELFDAYDDAFLAYIGPDDTSELAFLPLEDSFRDTPFVPDTIIIDHHGGGSLGWLAMLGLVIATLGRFLLTVLSEKRAE